ncbi:hypothetical protein RJ639_023556 [Escallonia herrerae]|uniref:Uncharacterized protein n=1 Tax=Escallonia herrerae TaxID=1293975 RepID=A0AA89AEZ5_9ASTE|nr:hypothetical protein RJ639_023556 [Escallonia herrerae]
MKDKCERDVVEKMVKDLMEVRKGDFIRAANEMCKLARKSMGEGGTSYYNLDRLIKDIKLMNAHSPHALTPTTGPKDPMDDQGALPPHALIFPLSWPGFSPFLAFTSLSSSLTSSTLASNTSHQHRLPLGNLFRL